MIHDYNTLVALMQPILRNHQETFNFAQINFRHKDLSGGGKLVYLYRDRVDVGGAALGENVFWQAGGQDILTGKPFHSPFIGLTDEDRGYSVPILRVSYPEVKKEHFGLIFQVLPIDYYSKDFGVDSFAFAKDADHLGSNWFDAGKKTERLYVRYDPAYGMNDDPTIVVVGDVPNIEAIVDAAKQAGLHYSVQKSKKKAPDSSELVRT